MDFFKSVFSDEPDSPKSEPESESLKRKEQSDSDPNSPAKPENPNPISSPSDGGGVGGWSFGGLIKTLTTKSESVIEIYRRDLKEFGSGLRKEIEVAQGSLENVGQAIDEMGSSVLKGTAQMISQGKEAILSADLESDSSDNNNDRNIAGQQSLNSIRYSRFDAQVRAIQGDANTYCEGPEDLDDYKKWKSGFVLEEKREEIDSLIEENAAIESIYKRVVPASVDEETFWSRYYYRVYKLKQAEDLRANIVKRAISSEEDDLRWDVDEDEEENENERNVGLKVNLKANDDLGVKDSTNISQDQQSNDLKEIGSKESEPIVTSHRNEKMSCGESERPLNVKEEEEKSIEESKGDKIPRGSDNATSEKVDLQKNKEDGVSKSDEQSGSEAKGDNGESSKGSEFSVVSSHPSMPEEEDLGWDEIEDLSSIEDKKVGHNGSPSKIDLPKRLSAPEEEEDLSWDIEDDDEPIKA